uniref:PepSY domain-containing protein n=1 Tax=Desulfobacca acetoxidans TaxID=60893 RepID=A0A7V4G7T2_9BACT
MSCARPAAPPLASPRCSIKVPEPEPADLTALARISAAAAIAAAQAAFPGAPVRALLLENAKGCLIYRVFLGSGLEVQVDAGTGQVLPSESEDEEEYQDLKDQKKKR